MNIIQQFFKSIYSPETIAKFRMQKIGKTILYVFFLMLLVTIPPAVILGSSISSFYNKTEHHMVNTFPDFSIENGVLYSDETEPIIVEEDGEVIIFDSTGELTPSDLEGYETAFALLENDIVVITDGFHQTIWYQEVGINMTKGEAMELIESFGSVLPLIIGLIIFLTYIFTTGMKFFGIFTLSLIGLLLKRKNAANLSYKSVWVLSAYTVTLPTVLFAILDALRIQIPFFSFTLYWVIAIVMLYLVFTNIPQPREPVEELVNQ
ncbi:DUF1189 domain-containing protein [Evansella tamaricis]|uniref:DUF1189 domain-containing protein n=1 Tax=Evansella tamaricis TaxID=2069301 RepID=A0ABS6JEK5_9BACI|nr:DUF1189 domain-containing protein [Evansella tamaricis]MBU9712111.1 DUF1189 domain-containing protein [Evansella tamaricis]